MSTESNKAAVRRLIEQGINKGDEKVIDELIGPNFHSNEESMGAAGPDGFKELLGVFRTAFPDGRLVIAEILGDGDKVITWGTYEGTHQGPMQDIPATGKAVKVKDVDMYRLVNGQVVESWAHFDQLGMLQQMGVLGGIGEAERE